MYVRPDRVVHGHGQAYRQPPSSSPLVPRIVLTTLIFTAIAGPRLYDPLLSSSYRFFAQSTLYRLSTFETLETVFCYTLIENAFVFKFRRNPSLRIDIRTQKTADPRFTCENPKRPRMRGLPQRLYDVVRYVFPLLMLDFALVKKYADVSVADIRRSGGYSPFHASVGSNFLAPNFHRFTSTSPLQLWRALPKEPPSSRRLVLEILVSIFIFDALFFLSHLAFHRLRFLARFHKPHHRHAEIHPQVTDQLSVVERLTLVLLANFSLNIIGSHVLTRTVFIPIFVYLLVEIHSGLDLAWTSEKILPRGWGAGARKHAQHHREGEGNFQPFFCWWDYGLIRMERFCGGLSIRPKANERDSKVQGRT
jgi:cholesterol 25-hydroxylase